MTKATSSQPNNKCKIIYLVKKKPTNLGYLSRNNSLGRGIAKKDLAYSGSQIEYFSNVRMLPSKNNSFWNVLRGMPYTREITTPLPHC